MCPNTTFQFEISGIDLPDGGTMDWYAGTFPNFDPSKGQGTLIGSTGIANPDPADCSPCPTILAIFLDACNGNGSEADNEFICISSGGGFNVNSLQINLNNNDSQGNNDIQLGSDPCGFQIPSAALMANILNDASCNGSNIHFVGPGEVVPAAAIAIVFTSAGENFDYNFGTLCATGQPIYILQSSCTRIMNIGAFTNYTSSGTRTYSISLIDCPFCTNSL
ncbi:MAG: hypothetical protein ABIV51_00205, partial [Saprospiraceae bacterium]